MIIFLISQWSFGQNKVEAKDIKWKVLDTEHFKIYHYQGGETLADFASLVLEEAFNEFKDYFPGAIKSGEKIPVLIYVSYKDFSANQRITIHSAGRCGGLYGGF
jgi:hypothetical protein